MGFVKLNFALYINRMIKNPKLSLDHPKSNKLDKLVSEDDEETLGRMLRVASDIARNEGLGEKGYRLIINCKEHGGQEVYYLHMHMVGGTRLGRMIAQ